MIPDRADRPLVIHRLGRRDYGEVLDLQRRLCRERIAGHSSEDLLVLVEHPPVVTLGRGTKSTSLPLSPADLERRGLAVYEVERGGDVTYHGPGQLVGYPILDLRTHRLDLHWYLRQLECALIATLAQFGLEGEQREGYTGVWIGDRKIASIGVHVKQWVTFHGFALNVTTPLEAFDLIVPCGIPGVRMTSLAHEGAGPRESLWRDTEQAVIGAMADAFDRTPVPGPAGALGESG